MRKKLFAILMSALMMVSFMPSMAFATGNNVAKIGDTEFATLAEAIEAAKTADQTAGNDVMQTIELLENVELSTTVEIDNSLKIMMSEKNITATNCRALQIKAKDVTIEGKGTISSTGEIGSNNSVIRVGENDNKPASLALGKDVTVSTDKCYAISIFNGVSNKAPTEEVSLVVNGTVSSTDVPAISGVGNSYNGVTDITIGKTAKITTTNENAIYFPCAGKLDIQGSVEGKGGIEVKAGATTVAVDNTAKIKATAESVTHNKNNDGCSTSGYAIALVENKGYKGDAEVTINGGDITGPVDIVKDDEDVASEKQGNIVINGGAFSNLDVLKYVADGKTVKLNKDITLSDTYHFNKTSTGKVTLNLNGHNITGNNIRAIQVDEGSLEIAGTGIVSANGTIADNSSVIRVGQNEDKGATLTLGENVTVSTSACYAISIFNGKDSTNNTQATNKVSLIVNGTVTSTNAPAISGVGNTYNGVTDITIGETAKVTTTNENAIYFPCAGKLDIQGSVVGNGGVEVKAGETTVAVGENAKIEATAASSGHTKNNNGCSTSGYAIALVENSGYKGGARVTVNGGAITGQVAIVVDDTVDTEKKGQIILKGGSYSVKPAEAYIADTFVALEDTTNQVWNVIPDTQYTVTFNANGGTNAPAAQTVYNGHKATAPTTNPTKTGYKVAGWYTSATPAAGAAAWNFSTNTVTANITLYAKWEAVKYNVAFDKNDTAAVGTMSYQQMTYDTTAALKPNTFTNNGYVFAGWNTLSNGRGTSYADKASVKNLTSTENATVTLYAQWTKQTVAPSGGGAVVDATEEVKVVTTTSTVTITDNYVKNIMKEVAAAKSTSITINAVSTETGADKVTTSQAVIPTSFAKTLGAATSTVNALIIETNVGAIELDKAALESVAAQAAYAKGTTVTIEIKKVAQKYGDIDQDYEITVKVNDTKKTVITDFDGGVETVTVPIPTSLKNEVIACLYVKADNSVESVEKVAQTTTAFTFKTGHNSIYRLTTADNASAQIKELVNEATVYQKKLVAYKNGKIKVSWEAADGYDVDRYQIWRATKKNGKYKKFYVKDASEFTYINSKSLKKGKKYYYKVRGSVQLDNGSWAYTEWSNIRYATCKKSR